MFDFHHAVHIYNSFEKKIFTIFHKKKTNDDEILSKR